MVMQIYASTVITTGIIADLAALHDALITPQGFISSTDDTAVVGTGSGHEVTVRGRVIGDDMGIMLGDSHTTDIGQSVTVEEGGRVAAAASYGVLVKGIEGVVTNHGDITGAYGVGLYGEGAGTHSTLINTGRIIGTDPLGTAIHRFGAEDFTLINRGLVKSSNGVAFDGTTSSAIQTIINSGKFVGSIYFGSGDDVYRSGRNGDVTANVFGAGGEDRMIGGRKADWFWGEEDRDTLTGGAGRDRFAFDGPTHSIAEPWGRDRITDFQRGEDRIFLGLDAAQSTGLNEDFTFLGRAAFSGDESELRYRYEGRKTIVEGDTDGDGFADLAIELDGRMKLSEGDFIL